MLQDICTPNSHLNVLDFKLKTSRFSFHSTECCGMLYMYGLSGDMLSEEEVSDVEKILSDTIFTYEEGADIPLCFISSEENYLLIKDLFKKHSVVVSEPFLGKGGKEFRIGMTNEMGNFDDYHWSESLDLDNESSGNTNTILQQIGDEEAKFLSAFSYEYASQVIQPEAPSNVVYSFWFGEINPAPRVGYSVLKYNVQHNFPLMFVLTKYQLKLMGSFSGVLQKYEIKNWINNNTNNRCYLYLIPPNTKFSKEDFQSVVDKDNTGDYQKLFTHTFKQVFN